MKLFPGLRAQLQNKVSSPTTVNARLAKFVTAVVLLQWIVLHLSGILSDVRQLACTSVIWTNAHQCGLNGRYCRPFEGSSFRFRCPAGCAKITDIERFEIGNQTITQGPLVVGGGDEDENDDSPYHAASWICPAALHAGIITDSYGGCGSLHRKGEAKHYIGSERNGIKSSSLSSSFISSYSFETDACGYKDLSWLHTVISLLASFLSIWISSVITEDTLTARSTHASLPKKQDTSYFQSLAQHTRVFRPEIFYYFNFVSAFFEVALVSDPPDEPYIVAFRDRITVLTERLFPAVAIAIAWQFKFCNPRIIWTLGVKFSFLAGLWMGVFCNLYEPLSRYIPRTPVLIFVIAPYIVYLIWREYIFWRNEDKIAGLLIGLVSFALGLIILKICEISFGLRIHFHHYFWPNLLLLAISTTDRQALFICGLLFGISINGMGRWGFAAILESRASDIGEAFGNVLEHVMVKIQNNIITLEISALPTGFDGLNIEVNDVLEFQYFKEQIPKVLTWTRPYQQDTYLRFGAVTENEYRGLSDSSWSNLLVWYANGTWTKTFMVSQK